MTAGSAATCSEGRSSPGSSLAGGASEVLIFKWDKQQATDLSSA